MKKEKDCLLCEHCKRIEDAAKESYMNDGNWYVCEKMGTIWLCNAARKYAYCNYYEEREVDGL